MELICGHGAPSYGRPLCPHIRAAAQPLGYFTRYTGVGLSVDRVCQACRDCVADGLAVVTDAVCEECFDVVDGDLVGWVGMPEVRDRPRDVDPTVRSTAVPVGLGAVVDLAAVDEAAAVWLALCEDGRIVRWESDSGTWTVLARSTVEVQEDAEPWAGRQQVRRLHVSPDGRFAAVVLDHGRHGEVFDLSTGTVTLTLDGGGYRPDTVRFSAAFAEHRGRTVLVHRTGWNRLDVSDPQTGQLLTVREFEAARTGSSRPPHDLDFFHGALTVSPDGRHVADDGWVWAPSGVVTAWSLSRWLDENPYESEDGPSLLCLTLCTHYWAGRSSGSTNAGSRSAAWARTTTRSRPEPGSSTSTGPATARPVSPRPWRPRHSVVRTAGSSATAGCSSRPPHPAWRSGTPRKASAWPPSRTSGRPTITALPGNSSNWTEQSCCAGASTRACCRDQPAEP